jgi:hypothetical protein
MQRMDVSLSAANGSRWLADQTLPSQFLLNFLIARIFAVFLVG